MTQKIAIAVIHGIGKANPSFNDPNSPNFTSGIAQKLKSQFADLLGKTEDWADTTLEFEAIYWAPVLQNLQDELYQRLGIDQKLSSFLGLRDFIFHSLADSVGYQITSSTPPSDRDIYDKVHACFAAGLHRLAQRAGRNAPLCIISHSLGTTIASNYVWDLQAGRRLKLVEDNPLEQGETLALFYTLGSQIAFWSLRYNDFGKAVLVPSPKLSTHYPGLEGEWLNFYDRDDLLGYPIKTINDDYKNKVTADIEVNAGNIAKSWNPLSHNEYWRDDEVTKRIARSLARTWQQINAA